MSNWNVVLSSTRNLNDVLIVLQKVLALLQNKADVTTIDEALDSLATLDQQAADSIREMTNRLNQFGDDADAATNEAIMRATVRGFATEALLKQWKPNFDGARAKADDTKKIWRWELTSAVGVTPITGNWVDTGLSELDLAKNFVKARSLEASDLNTVLNEGDYFQAIAANATSANNYPANAQNTASSMRVTSMSVNTIQQTVSASGKVATRIVRGITTTPVFEQWSITLGATDKNDIYTDIIKTANNITKRLEWFVSGTNGAIIYDKSNKKLSSATALIAAYQASTRRIMLPAFSVEFSGAAYETLYLDLSQIPADGTVSPENLNNCLKLAKYNDAAASAFIDKPNQIPLAKMTPQGNVEACAGFPKILSDLQVKDTFSYKKTADRIHVYLPASNGNLINYMIRHDNKPFDVAQSQSQLDLWRIERALEVNASLATIQEIVTYGEWEFTMRESAYPADHVGGVHGDELLISALFLVDGVYKDPNTWVQNGEAKEIRLQQHSVIYRLNTQTTIAKHYKELIITKDGITANQEVEMLIESNIDRFWLAMLPTNRTATNGVLVSTRDIRNGTMRDISSASFNKIYTPLKNHSNIIVCGDKYSTSVEIQDLFGVLDSADIHVSNDAAYNKIYVSAIGGSSNGLTLESGHRVGWKTNYKVDAIE